MADTWTAISGYTPQDYTDTAVFEVNSDTKKIALITGQPLVSGEENAQYMRFSLDRYWDGIDIKDKAFYVEYALAGTYYGKTAAVNAEYNTEQIRFGWVVPKEACCISGTLLFILRIESEDYVLKTQIAEHPVFKSVNVEDVVPEPTKEEWYREFEARVDNAISEAENAISAAQTAQVGAEIAAQNAQTAEANAEAAAAMAQIRYGSPLVAQTAEEMVEQNRVYVYTGSETGYTAGHWYYYNGTEWADGGVYNSVAVDTDTTLSISGKAADAKKTGDEINSIKVDLSDNVYGIRTNVTTDTDLNDLVDVGSYLLFANHVYTNIPPVYTSGAAWVFVVADTSKNYRFQIFAHHYWKKWAVRSYSKTSSTAEGTWSDWVVYDDMQRALIGKKLSIIGDSISTFRGYNPEGYSYQYPVGDVTTVGKTWWQKLIDRTGMTLVANASWSGSTVTDDDSDPTNSAKVGYSDARIADLSADGVTPDIVIVLFGTNDFSKGRGLGTLTERSEIPDGTTSINTFREAYACMLNKIRTAYPEAHVYCCTLIQRYYSTDTNYPILNGNSVALSEFNKAITDIATWIGCNIIRLDTLFTPASLPNYTTDGKLHPNTAGMAQIATRVAQVLAQNEIDYLG